jgi:signal transduction histidine kinase
VRLTLADARTVPNAGARAPSAVLGALEVAVTDDGVGLWAPAAARHAGVGLASMRERAAELGGIVLIEPLPTGGTRVLARLPLATSALQAGE